MLNSMTKITRRLLLLEITATVIFFTASCQTNVEKKQLLNRILSSSPSITNGYCFEQSDYKSVNERKRFFIIDTSFMKSSNSTTDLETQLLKPQALL